MQPMKAIMDKAIAAEADGTVLNTSLFGCFPLADIPHVGLSAVVVADGDRDRAERFLYDLLAMAWKDREGFVFNVEPIADSVAEARRRSEEHTSELQSLMRTPYAVFCLKKNTIHQPHPPTLQQ